MTSPTRLPLTGSRPLSRLAFTSIAGLALTLMALPADASCRRMGFLVNDYGKDGPTKDAQELLEKDIAKWAAGQGIKTYTVNKKDVSCELFLNFIVFDEHTCTASATVCWDEKNPGKPAAAEEAKADGSAVSVTEPAKPEKAAAKPAKAEAKKVAAKPAADATAAAAPASSEEKKASKVETGAVQAKAAEEPAAATEAPAATGQAAKAAPAKDPSQLAAEAAERAAAAAERAAVAAERAAQAAMDAQPAAGAAGAAATAPSATPAAVAPITPLPAATP